jgi:hypothetical protein
LSGILKHMEHSMQRWTIVGVVIAGAVAGTLAACAEKRNDVPSGPAASVTALTSLPSCDLSGTNPLVSHYFSSDEAKTVRASIDQISAAGAGTVIARDRGFDIIARIAANAQAGTGGDASLASELINDLTACMFRDLAEFPENYPEDYTIAVTTAQPGGLGVRGGSADPATAPVLSRGSFSGVAPQLGGAWATMLGGNPAPARIALYGRPGSTPQTYDWKVLPRNATFSPPAIVGVCVDPNAATTAMLHEEHVGLLTFSDAYFLDPVSCVSLASRTAGGLTDWTQRLEQLFLPRTLAASTITRGGIGGSTGGIGSEFGLDNVPTVTTAFTIQPPATVTVGQVFSLQIRATDPITGASVGGVRVAIIAVNNNGVPKNLLGTTSQTTTNAGLATFTDLRFDAGSTGGFRLVVGGDVLGRPAIGVGQATSTKINAKPAK